jgi:hypothetical protein
MWNLKCLWRAVYAAIAGVLLLFAIRTSAMSLTEVDGSLFATGEVVASDLVSFKNAFMSPSVRQIVLVDSPGGDAVAGLEIGRLIKEHEYSTVVAGQCISACAIMFIGGKQRQFADTYHPAVTLIGIHGSHEVDVFTNKVTMSWEAEKVTRRQEAFFKKQMGERFNEGVMKRALYGMEDEDALLVIPDSIRERKASVYFCKSGLTERKDCSDVATEDAFSLGVLTSREIVAIDIPASIQTVLDAAAKKPVTSSKGRTGIEMATRDELIKCIGEEDAIGNAEISLQEAQNSVESEKNSLEAEFDKFTSEQVKLDTRDRKKVAAFNFRTENYNVNLKRLNDRIDAVNAMAVAYNLMRGNYNRTCGRIVYASDDYQNVLNEYNSRKQVLPASR